MKTLFSVATPLRVAFFLAFGLFFFTSCEKDRVECFDCDTEQTVTPRDHEAHAFFSSNTAGEIAIYSPSGFANAVDVPYDDADGIAYISSTGKLYQANRSMGRLVAYNNFDEDAASATPSYASAANSFSNGREIAVSGNFIVVANDDPNQFVIFEDTGSALMMWGTINSTVNLWGIEFVGDDLYVVEDNTSNLAIFQNFLSNSPGSTVSPTFSLTIMGIVRTHGLHYNAADDVMILTDVGSGGDATDGAFHFITDWTFKMNGFLRFVRRGSDGVLRTTIPMNQQIRVAGSNTFLGNPVDVDYRHATDEIYIAERANAGGRVLIFDAPTSSGNFAPTTNNMFAGASAVDVN